MFLVFALLLSLAGCGGNTEAESSQSSSTDVPPQESSSIVSPEPAYPETETLDFLNEEQIQLYETAKKMAQMFVFDAGNIHLVLPNTRVSNELVQIDGYGQNGYLNNYYLVEGPYSQYDDFKTYMLQFYTENYFDTMSKPHFVSYNGRLAALDASMGGNISRSRVDDTYQLLEKTGDKIKFNVIGHYIGDQRENESDDDYNERRETTFDYVKMYPIEMVMTENGWRVNEFHVTNGP